MVKTRSQGAEPTEEEQQYVAAQNVTHYVEPLSSPSLRPAASRLRSPTRSRRSTTSSAARIRRQLELQAQERLAEITRREMRLEADLIRKRLEVDLEDIDEDERASNVSRMEERVNDWLQTAEETSYPAPTLSTEQRGRTGLLTPDDRRGELAVTRVTFEAEATAPEVTGETSPRRVATERRRARTPTPTREQPSDIQQLAEALRTMTTRERHILPRQSTDLPDFSGAPNKWLPFKAAMTESTRLYQIRPVENLARLRVCLKGEAREAVAPLLHTAENPEAIMRTLERCYGQPDIIINNAMDKLRQLPQAGITAKELNTFAVRVENVIAVLRNVGHSNYLRNPQLAGEILERMSPLLVTRWRDFAHLHRTSEECEVILLSRFLTNEADLAYEYTHQSSITGAGAATARIAGTGNIAPPMRAKSQQNSKPPRRTARGAAVYAANEERRSCPACLCCGSDHDIHSCRRLKTMKVSDRWAWAKSARACFKCLKQRHRRADCRAGACGVNGCTGPHHTLLHDVDRTSIQPPSNTANSHSPASEEAVMSIATPTQESSVLLKVCSVVITGPEGEVTTYALLDEGSSVTLIDQEVADIIGAKGVVTPLRLRGVNATAEQAQSQRITIQIRGRRERAAHDMSARTIRKLDLRQQRAPRSLLHYEHLRGLEEACYVNARPRVLIGADNWHLMVSKQLRAGKKSEPAASLTSLGWVIYGVVPRLLHRHEESAVLHVYAADRDRSSTASNRSQQDESLHEMVKEHFSIDNLGVSLTTKQKPEDRRAVEIFNRTARRVNNRYEVGLPWRTDDVTLPPSYSEAFTRLRGIEKKMDRDPTFRTEYIRQMDNLLKKGYAERYNGSERDSTRQWFLPHFAVRNPNKPGKVRLVFDAASRVQNTSLNDHLLEGPDLLLSLPGILFRFRERPVAVIADIAEMFLQVRIRAEDQPAQSFLWRGEDRSSPPDRYKMTSMIFGAASSPFLAHSVRDRNAHEHAHSHARAFPLITRSHYMDDLVHSFANTDEAQKAVKEVIAVHAQASFTLRGWNTNCPLLLSIVPPELRAQKQTTLGHGTGQEKTLGMMWDAARDELGFNTALARVPEQVRNRQRAPTKREALAAVMSIFDPLGLLSCYTITAKIVLQDLWRMQVGWDEPLPEEHAERFDSWLSALDSIAQLRLERLYGSDDDGAEPERELHIFVDASEQAYAAAAYWRLQYANNRVVVVLAAAKAKLAPLRPHTIPRLELQAAVIGTRLAEMVRREHRMKTDRVIYWTDSTTVLQWIRTDARRYTPYVAHRLGEIAEATDITQWRWVPTAHNVADDATREGRVLTDQQDRWFVGPTFLYGPELSWPQERQRRSSIGSAEGTQCYAADAEDASPVSHTERSRGPEPSRLRPHRRSTDSVEGARCYTASAEGSSPLPDISRFSNYERLIRATATVLAFVDKCRRKATQLELRHIELAERLWLTQAQTEEFSAEITRLRAGRTLPAASRLVKLDPVLEEDLLRVRGRIDAARAPYEAKRPIILSGRHPLTRLIVLREHAAAEHASNERVLNDLRQRFWILRARPTVRAVARACALCKVRRAEPRVPPMGNLPPARLDQHRRPFTNCGVDYFGPLIITIGRRREKRWVSLFTCLTTRAVHLELVSGLSADSEIMALRRMAARRGWPRQLWSDNGTKFRGADAELRAAYNAWEPALLAYAQVRRMEWRFIPPGAPNQGGAWERLVRSVKAALSATLREQAPREEVLATLLLEAEHAVNSRPLTHVSVDPTDPEALTPNHFLIGTSTGLPQTGACAPADRRAWRTAQGLADQFWQRWVREYLPTLVPRGGSYDGGRPLQPGDLVIVVDAALPRNTWPRGIIEAVHRGPDGDVRSALVRTNGGTFVRPTRKLAVLRQE